MTAISDQERANLLVQWAQLDDSGIATINAMEILRDGATPLIATRLSRALASINTGASPAKAWAGAGLLYRWQCELVDAGFASGRGARALRSMAQSANARIGRWKRFQSKMVLPFAVMILAGLLASLPSLLANEIGFIGFLLRIALLPGLIAMAIMGSVRMLQGAEEHGVSSFIVNLPVISKWLEKRSRADFLTITAQALKAGIPALQAVPLAISAIRPVSLGQRFTLVNDGLLEGLPLAEALQQGKALDAAGFALVNAGEFAGAVDDMLERSAATVEREAQQYADRIATLAPTVIYCLLGVMMMIKIVGFWTSFSKIAGGY